jgi:predicted molibdopterin-dependent oxidoreductase YjgC
MTGSRTSASSGRASTVTTRARRTSTRPNGKGKFFPVEYQPPIEQPDSEFPFVLSTGRTLYHYNSATMTMREKGVTEKQEEPFVEIHPEDAAGLGIEHGEWVRLVSRRGELEARAALTERVYPGLVWMALHFAQAKVNWLTHDVGDSLIGTPEYKTSAVRVEALASDHTPSPP